MSKASGAWVRAIFSAGALAWVFSRTSFQTVFEILKTASLPLLIAGVTVNVGTRFAAAERTQVMNRALGLGVTRAQTIATLFISNFYALLSPGPWLSGVVTVFRYKKMGASVSGSVGSLLASRLVEAVTFLFWGIAFALWDDRLNPAVARPALRIASAVLACAAVLLVLWWAWHRPRRGAVAADPVPSLSWMAKLRQAVLQILMIGPFVSLKAALPASLQLLMSGIGLALLARAVGCDMAWASGIWLCAAVYAVVLLPISIAGLGVRDVTLVKCFALLGFAPRAAIAVSLLLFLDQLISAVIGAVLQFASAAPARRVGVTN